MYQVLLADDEPIILSGIKFLIDWEKNDCVVVGSARNGQQALERIRQLRPDIVICDINMPLMSGIELLSVVSEEMPSVVFLMLTNHQEFDLAREALRLRAVDYLLKNQLEAEALEKSLAGAKEERRQRLLLESAATEEPHPAVGRVTIQEALTRLLQSAPGSPLLELSDALVQNGFVPGFALFYLPVDFGAQECSTGDAQRLFSWQREVVDKLSENCFPRHFLFAPDRQCESLLLMVWEISPERWNERLSQFSARLSSASENITQAKTGMLSTDLFMEIDSLEDVRNQLFQLRDYYYLHPVSRMRYCEMPPINYQSLGFSGAAAQLERELLAKNTAGCTALLERARAVVAETPHRCSQAVWLCGELYYTACAALAKLISEPVEEGSFFHRETGYRQIELLCTREQVLGWLSLLQSELSSWLMELSGNRPELCERARQYILQNLRQKIMLQDVAEHVAISPGYLSAMFKRTYHQNLVDFINQCKMEEACRLIEAGEHRMGEISYLLSFENAYYFTKVFRRHTGMTPTEYQKKLRSN